MTKKNDSFQTLLGATALLVALAPGALLYAKYGYIEMWAYATIILTVLGVFIHTSRLLAVANAAMVLSALKKIQNKLETEEGKENAGGA